MNIESLTRRFWQKVNKTDDCWLWTACHDGKGYGMIAISHSKCIRATRASWIIHHGSIDDGLCVLHRCDNPQCVRPDHLFLGTKAENNIDCMNKGRRPPLKGARHWNAKLDDPKVLDILSRGSAGDSQKAIAETYGITTACVRQILAGTSWKHIPRKGQDDEMHETD